MGNINLNSGWFLYFDGNSQSITVPNTDNRFQPTMQTTWELWFKIDMSNHAQYDTLMGFATNNWDIRMDGATNFTGHWYPASGAWGSTIQLPSSYSLWDEQWHHIAIVWDGAAGTKKGYVDGVLTLGGTFTPEAPRDLSAYSFADFTLGGANSGTQRTMCGNIKDVRVWQTARTEAEILSNKDIKLTGTETGLLFYLPLDDGNSTNVVDLASGFEVNMNGSTWVKIAEPKMELTKDGELKIAGSINTRLPAITDGLVAHFPFDGPGGAFDMVGGAQTVQNIESGVNLIEAMQLDWRDPSSWASNAGMSWDESKQALRIEGYHNSWLKTPIVVDTTKTYHVSIEVMEEVQSSTGLYLGGLCNNAAGERVTSNYDYSYAANAQPTTGVWTQYCTTRTGTGAIVSRTSQSYSNISGWTGDRTGITDLLTKYYYYGGLFNYSSGGVMYIRNPQIIVVDSDISNCTFCEDGINVDRGTTNVVTNTNLNTGWSQNYQTNIVFNEIPPPYGINSPVVGFDRGNSSCYWYSYGDYAPQVPGTTYTVSLYVKTLDPGFSIKFYTADNSEVGRYNSEYRTVPNDGQWHRVVWDSFTNPVDSQSNSLSFNFTMSEAIGSPLSRTWFCAPQMEPLPFVTSFTATSSSKSRLIIPINKNLDTEPMTYIFNVRPNNDLPLLGAASYASAGHTHAYGGLVDFKTTEGGRFDCWWQRDDGTPGISTIRFLSGDAVGGTWVDVGPRSALKDDKITIAFTFDGYTTTGYVILNGILYKNGITRTGNVGILNEIWMDGYANGYLASNTINNVSVYNRILNDDEIYLLAQNNIKTEINGDIKATSYNAETHKIEDTRTIHLSDKTYGLSNETNIGFRDGSMWVGTSTINYAQHPWSAHTPYYNYSREGERHICYRHETSTSPTLALQCSTLTSALVTGDTYTVSGYLFLNGKPYKTTVPHISTYHTTTTRSISRDDGYFEYTQTFGTSGWVFHSNICGAVIGDTIEIRDLQVEKGVSHASAFTPTSRGDSIANFPGDIIDLNKGTVGCWFYPTEGFFNVSSWNRVFGHSTGGNQNEIQVKRNGTGTNLVMSISNAAGSPQAGWSSCPSATITPNKWYFVVARWDITAGTMSLTVDGVKNEQAWTTTYQPTAYGDFAIGHHPTYGRPANSYFKDMFIAKRMLTDEELNDIYNTKMMMTKDGGLQVQNSIITGQVI